jgi:ribosomal protein L37AE/L43A
MSCAPGRNRTYDLHIRLSAVGWPVVAGDLRPVGGRDYPRTYQEFRSWFTDEWACREYLAELRWPHGFSCPDCGSGDCWRTGTGLWMCSGCGLKTSVTAGTLFHRSHTPTVDLVRRDLVRHLAEERGVGAGFTGGPRVRLL